MWKQNLYGPGSLMAEQKVSQDDINNLVEDASYLQDEAEAMQYVIDNIPYKKSPPKGRSIAEMLLLIDHAQLSYYRPILEEAVDTSRPTHLENYTHFRENFETDEEKMDDIQKVLGKLAKHRAGLVNSIKNIPLIDWETSVYKDGQEVLLYHFMQEMIRFERSMLKDIAEQVKMYGEEKKRKRDIEERRSRQQNQQPSENT